MAHRLHADDVDLMVLPRLRLVDGLALQRLGRSHLDDGEVIVKLDEVHHLSRDQVRGPDAGVVLGVDHMVA
ncbi:MAG: hypothetical protein HLX46_03085, partial [Corynebacterium sp.]|uniref:hypothetical protein n=1 Tax=Corynebacterium sp. TaxID=1720 RepID=UPI0018090DF0